MPWASGHLGLGTRHPEAKEVEPCWFISVAATAAAQGGGSTRTPRPHGGACGDISRLVPPLAPRLLSHGACRCAAPVAAPEEGRPLLAALPDMRGVADSDHVTLMPVVDI